MEITDAIFAAPFEGADPGVKLRIEAQGSNFLHRAAPIIAQVGDVIVENIFVSLDGGGFVGQLRTFPKNGDKLKVGYLGAPLVTTNIVYHPPIS
jgi:hypothetical protein